MTEATYPTIHCDFCGRQERLYYVERIINKLLAQGACHSCGFWLDRAAEDAGRRAGTYVLTPDYEHYQIGDEEARSGPRGSFRGATRS